MLIFAKLMFSLDYFKSFVIFVEVLETMKPALYMGLLLLGVAFCTPSYGQDSSFGLFNSPKGFGLAFQKETQPGFDILELYADTYGVFSGRCQDPGLKISYTHAYVLGEFAGDEYLCSFYVGPGCGMGYIRDFESGIFMKDVLPLSRNKGIAAALSVKSGFVFQFQRRIDLDLGFKFEGGIHVRPEERGRGLALSLYENGVYQTFLPELSILFRF